VEVLWQAPSSVEPPEGVWPIEPLNIATRKTGRSKLHRAWDFAYDTLAPYSQLERAIQRCHPDAVLLSAWSEYFSPLWAGKLRGFREAGVRFGAVIHDPVRDTVRGPVWWHRWSVRQAYSFLDVAFTHDAGALDYCGSSAKFEIVQIPHGPLPVPEGVADKVFLRDEFGIPADVNVLLSFGHIRDGKNLNQAIEALRLLPNVHLLVAGREQSGGQKPVRFYQALAAREGVAHRCHWHTDYIPNDVVWKYFRTSDLLLLTYSQDFRSASGVLNVNGQFRLPVLASAGGGPLLDAVNRYNLGIVLGEPTPQLIAEAVARALGGKGDWVSFTKENSWGLNADKVVKAFSSAPSRK